MLTISEARQDLAQAYYLIDRHFPNLGLYGDEDDIQMAFIALDEALSVWPEDQVQRGVFARTLQKIVVQLGDGHTCIRPNPTDMFPFAVKPLEDAVVLSAEIDGFGSWSKIIAINDRPIEQLLDTLAELTCVDGGGLEGARRIAADDFSGQFALLYHQSASMRLRLIDAQDKVRDVKLKDGKIFEGLRLIGQIYSTRTLEESLPVLSWPSAKVALLTISGFSRDARSFEQAIDKIFKEIADRGATDLIVDVRGNHGGLIRNASLTLSHLLDRSHFFPKYLHVQEVGFKKNDLSFAKASDNAERAFQERMRRTINENLASYLQHVSTAEIYPRGKRVATKSVLWGRNAYRNRLHVLIDETTASAAAMFANQLDAYRQATFYGAPLSGSTGRGCMKSEIPFVLKNSQLQLDVAWLCFALNDAALNSDEVLKPLTPDFEMGRLFDDLKNGDDTVVDRVLRRIKGRSRPVLPTPKYRFEDSLKALQ